MNSRVSPSSRILVVDDERSILFALKDYFLLHGYQVDCAEEMEEAQALLANVQYSLAIVDMRLTGFGGAEGLEVLSFLKERCPWTRVMIWTGSDAAAIEKEVRRRGVDCYLHKPMPLAEVARVAIGLLGAVCA